MIPRTLQIKNFLSYGTDCPPISFENHTLICLSGNNGHGKSALLDAITWAIWGCARKIQNTARADHGLLRLGQSSMMVIFDCTVNNVAYRIKREFELVYGKPKTTLDIGIIDADGAIHSLTEKTLRDTQARIETIVGLDYETFVNSSFLRQGNANEFSKRSPKERKEIISTILGLGMYDALKKAALEKGKIAYQESLTLKTLLTYAQQEKETTLTLLNDYPTFCISLENITQECTAQKKRILKNSSLIAEQETTRQLCLNKLQEYTAKHMVYEQKIDSLKKTLLEWRMFRKKSFDHTAYISIQQELAAQETAYVIAQKKFAHYITIKEEVQEWDKKQVQATHLLAQKQAQQNAERTLILERLEHQRITLQEQIKTFSHQQNSYKQELNTLQRKITDQAALQKQIFFQLETASIRQKLFEKRKEAYHRWTTLGNIIRDEHGAQLQKLNLANDHANPSCPLCEQSLSAARKRFLQTKIESNLSIQAHRLARLKRILPHLKKMLVDDHAALQIITQQKNELHTLQHTHELDTQKAHVLDEAIGKTEALYLQLQAQEKTVAIQKEMLSTTKADTIKTTDIITLEQEIQNCAGTLAQLNEQLAALAYDPAHITTLHATIQRLQKELALLEENKKNLALQEERKNTITRVCTELKKEKIELAEQKKIESTLASCNTALEQLRLQESIESEHDKKLNAEREKLLIEQGRYHAAQASLATLEKTIAQHTIALEKVESIVTDYQVIATAVGRDGIQALLIEEAIPEIEEIANDLLAKLTNNNAHIMIESLRDLKNGGTKETLDIKISDAQGIRPYEMFSGGEAFRIDFALRIAISKLLAHRAGTALQTLIIDEGFGSQDEEGLSAMMDLLQALQGEFAKIIVVSHLPTMKDQFPVHFHVEKGSHGSVVHVIEQG